MAARSRFAEDELAQAVARGTWQYVVLGAGLDTFACRNPFGSRLRVFEVDFPATQDWKRGQLARAGIVPPPSVSFVPVDFEHQTAFDGLVAAGLDRSAPAFFSWLGVTMYLSTETVLSVLETIASMPAGGGVVFDYAVDPGLLGFVQRRVFEEFARRVASIGEPWTAFFSPAVLESEMRRIGFREVGDAGPEQINARYFADRSDGLQVGTLARLMKGLT
jgi:methyltransferase (TIGR00027 family)